MKPRNYSRQGVTLVELAIVLVIIGLIVGAILAGQSLIRGAELNAIVSEYRKFNTAFGQFRDKYSALPGDMSTAVSYWGNTVTGNGDGDGKIENTATAIGAAGATTSNEISNFWIHLTNSGFLEGSYTAVAGTTLTGGTNNPKSKAKGGAWNIAYLGTMDVNGTSSPVAGATVPDPSTFYTNTYEHVFLLGSGTNALLCASTGSCGIVSAPEAYSIDTKLDDGKPDTGDVTTLEGEGNTTAGSGCGNIATSTSALAASSYDLKNNSGSACAFVFKTGY